MTKSSGPFGGQGRLIDPFGSTPSTSLLKARAPRTVIEVADVSALVAGVVSPVVGAEMLSLAKAAGRILSSVVQSPISLPPFDHSAVDGYGLRSGDISRPDTMLRVAGRVLAGEQAGVLDEAAAIRIMTGAPIPKGCDAVVKQEHVDLREGHIRLSDVVRSSSNVRRVGEDVGIGDRLVREGTVLDTRHVALLAACGVGKVQVLRRVRIAIAAFGNELRKPGAPLRSGQIFDANSAMAATFLQRPYTRVLECVRSGDDRDRMGELLRDLAADADLIVTSGGMAAGDEDHTRHALEQAGGSWQRIALNMRPGRPAGLGRIGSAIVLGLPGNPFAALVALLVLGIPILDALTGSRRALRWSAAKCTTEFDGAPSRTEFFPARVTGRYASGFPLLERLGKGGSARLRPLVEADGLGRSVSATGSQIANRSLHYLSFAELLAP